MRFRLSYLYPLVLLFLVQCSPDKKEASSEDGSFWVSPEAGTSVSLGDKLTLQIQIDDSASVDSVVYLVDGRRQASSNTAGQSVIETKNLNLGNRLITAKIYRKDQPEEVSTNIILKSNLTPQKFTYKIQEVFDHDTSSYTQGLEYHMVFFTKATVVIPRRLAIQVCGELSPQQEK